MAIQSLRTPDSATEGLPGYPFAANYKNVGDGDDAGQHVHPVGEESRDDAGQHVHPVGEESRDDAGQHAHQVGEEPRDDAGLRMHYVDEGPRDGPVMLLLHGEPSWSYLYRKMIPPLAAAGMRCVAPDLIGFGRSDKPIERSDYSYAAHLNWLRSFLDQLEIESLNLFCQDWGGLLGLRLLAERPERFASVCAANTFLPTGLEPVPEPFFAWREFSQSVPEFPTGGIIAGATVRRVPDDVRAAYDAPFPDERYKAGARMFPLLVPVEPDLEEAQNNQAAWKVLARYERPFLTLFGDGDPVTAGAEKIFQSRVPGANGQPHKIIRDAGHFIQEDAGEELAEELLGWLR